MTSIPSGRSAGSAPWLDVELPPGTQVTRLSRCARGSGFPQLRLHGTRLRGTPPAETRRLRRSRERTSMGQLTGLRALVTGGASGLGAAIAAAFTAEGAAVVVLDMTEAPPAGLPAGTGYVAGRHHRRRRGAGRGAVGGRAAGRPGRAGQQRRHRCPGQRRAEHRRRMAAGAGRKRARDRPGVPRGLAVPAGVRARRRGQHGVDRGHRGAAGPGRVLGQQGRGGRAEPGHGRRRDARRHPGQRGEPGHGRHALGRPAAGRGARPGRRAGRAGGPAAPRPAGVGRGGRRGRRLPGLPGRRIPPPAPSWPWTAAWAACACGPGRDSASQHGPSQHGPRRHGGSRPG